MTKKFVVCEDEATLRQLLCDVIAEAFEPEIVVPAATGKEAIEAFKKHKPDLIVMDLIMPEMSGLKAIKEIFSIDPKANIVIVTAIRDEKFKMEALELGVKQYIEKPFKLNTFLDALYDIVE